MPLPTIKEETQEELNEATTPVIAPQASPVEPPPLELPPQALFNHPHYPLIHYPPIQWREVNGAWEAKPIFSGRFCGI